MVPLYVCGLSACGFQVHRTYIWLSRTIRSGNRSAEIKTISQIKVLLVLWAYVIFLFALSPFNKQRIMVYGFRQTAMYPFNI